MSELYFGGKIYDDVCTNDIANAIVDGAPDDVKKLLQHPKVYPNKLSLLMVKDICKLGNIKLILQDGRFDITSGGFLNLKLAILFNHLDARDLILEYTGSAGYPYAAIYSFGIKNEWVGYGYLNKCDFSDANVIRTLLDDLCYRFDVIEHIVNKENFNKNGITNNLLIRLKNDNRYEVLDLLKDIAL